MGRQPSRKRSLWYAGYLVLSAFVALPCVRLVPTAIERHRLSLAGVPLLLPSEMLAAKHLAAICAIAPLALATLFLLSFRLERLREEKAIMVCGMGLATLYGLFAVWLSLSFGTATMLHKVQLDEAKEALQESEEHTARGNLK